MRRPKPGRRRVITPVARRSGPGTGKGAGGGGSRVLGALNGPARDRLVAEAAEAVERIDADELEAYAAIVRARDVTP